MSVEYDAYLYEHIANVQKALRWMADTIILSEISQMSWSMAIDSAQRHDESKNWREEYNAYDNYFYGGNKTPLVQEEFDRAWLHHQKNNPHHWQYWVLINDDDGKNKALQMPVCYVLEMIADWWSFSWKNNDLMEIFKWYKDHEKKMVLHDETRKLVEKILNQMHKILTLREKHSDEDESKDIIEHSDKDDEDKEYGVPEQKKFPLPDADHVRSAIRFFNYVDPKYEQELADAINEKIAEYQMEGIHVGDENKFKKYVKEEYLEHHGILGQKWGIRRYQNPDGTLTEEGIYHYRKARANQRKEDIDSVYNRLSKKEKALIGDDENAKEYLSTDEGEYVVKRLVDRSDDKPVAFLDMMTSTKPGELIVTVATDPDYRGQGRAEKLARKGIKWFDKNGAKYGFEYLDWGFYEENKASQKVAEKVGFKFFKQDDDWIVYRYTTDPNVKHDDFDDEEADDILEHHGVMGQKWGIQNGPPYPIGSGGIADRSHYNNHTVFVSGSSKTTTEDSGYYRKDLPESIQNELKRHMHEGNKIIVGDAPGIDRQVQDFLNENDYYNVEVYGPGKKVRYSANSEWKTNPIDAPEYEEGSKEWLAKKDLAMSKAANEGLAIILDEGATATRKNIRRLANDDKDVKVFSLGADGNDNWVPEKMIKEIT